MAVIHAFAGAFSIMPIEVPDAVMKVSPRPRPRTREELRPVNVDLEALEIGARDASDECQSFLDTETGEVLCVVKGEPDERLLRMRIRAERKRYRRVPAFGLAEERALLREFLSEKMDGPAREFLAGLVDQPGAFHACLATLKRDEELWSSWGRFETRGLRSNLLAWMAGIGLRPRGMLSVELDD